MAVFDGVPVRIASAARTTLRQKTPQCEKWYPAQRRNNATKRATTGCLCGWSGGGRVASLNIGGREVDTTAPSGFMARDVAANSHYYSFVGGALRHVEIALDVRARATTDHIAIEGRLADTSGARSRCFACVRSSHQCAAGIGGVTFASKNRCPTRLSVPRPPPAIPARTDAYRFIHWPTFTTRAAA